jgi:arylsulfatase A-like enzyme
MHLASSLHRLNRTIKSIYVTLSTVGQLNSALIILASDHGGCYDAGGHIDDLRGCEGTLVKGGFKVNAFMYHSSILPSNTQDENYTNLFHMSD